MEPRRRQLILGLAFVLAIAGAFIFGYRAGRHALYIRRRNEPVRAWMSVPFIAHTHHVSAEILFQAAGIPPYPHDRRSLRRIAREEKRPVDDVVRAVESAIASARGSGPKQGHPTGKSP